MDASTVTNDGGVRTVELEITGMTCASCAARITRRLNGLEGVTAVVNLATDRARVEATSEQTDDVLLTAVRAAGYDATVRRESQPTVPDGADAAVRDLGRRLVVAAILFMPLCDASLFFSLLPRFRFDGWQVLVLVLAAPVVTWAAWPIYRGAVRAARHATCTMDTLVAIGIAASTGWSLAVLASATRTSQVHGLAVLIHPPSGSLYLDVAAGVTTFQLAGRFYEAIAKRRAGRVLTSLAAAGVAEATLLTPDGELRVPVASLSVGDAVIVRPGERIPVDGEVSSGASEIDSSVLTGESLPIAVAHGDTVLAGSVALNGRVVVSTGVPPGSFQVERAVELVHESLNERSNAQRVADRIAAVFVPVVIVVALATLCGWLLGGAGWDQAFSTALAVLIIACPCALGLATPTAMLVASSRAAQLGIFLKGYLALETSRHLDTVVLDKTGTLTHGRAEVVDIFAAPPWTRDDVLRLAGSVETASEHSFAGAILEAAALARVVLDEVREFRSVPGVGACGRVEARDVEVGRRALLDAADSSSGIRQAARHFEEQGCSVVAVVVDGAAIGVLGLADTIRPSGCEAVGALQKMGLRCLIVSGDGVGATTRVAAAVGADDFVADALPTDKVTAVRQLQAEGRTVAFVGDGINDAAALATADLGIAVGTATDVAIGAADMVLLRDDLLIVPTAIELARRTLATIHGNLIWAFAYNVAAIPLAVAGLLNPLVAAASMALSSSFVVWNSARLRRVEPHRAAT